MAFEINPNTLGPANTESNPRRAAGTVRDVHTPPARAHVNFIPSPDSLATLINSALAALRKGVFWDRGTILNLLV